MTYKKKFKDIAAILLTAFLLFQVAPLKIYALNSVGKVNSYIVKLNKQCSIKSIENLGFEILKKFEFSNNENFSNIYAFKSKREINQLRTNLAGCYEYLETNKIIRASNVVNDPGFTLNVDNTDKQWALPKLGFDKVWDKQIGSRTNIVAIIDTGLDATHEDLQAISVIEGFDFIKNEFIRGKINSDDNGHGTMVAGIIGATSNNGIGITGTNWLVSIMPLKVLGSDGKGDSLAISEAIVWAADHGSKIINLSLGGIGFGHDTTLANSIAYAFDKNNIIVAAAGNDMAVSGSNLDQEPVYPICDDNGSNMIIGVIATDSNDLKPEFSNYGKNCIDVASPGKRILSTINRDPFTKASSPNSYAYGSGTSMAVPFVSGEAALLWSENPGATNVQIRDRIISSADSIDKYNLSQCGGKTCKGLLGFGRINVETALKTKIAKQNLVERDLIKTLEDNTYYLIAGGQKNLVSPFVYNQQFQQKNYKIVPKKELDIFPDSPSYALPLEGTLVKFNNDPTVYAIFKGKKNPITLQVFKQRNYLFSQVNTLSFSELNSWITGDFYPPSDGVVIKSNKSKVLYWVIGGALHAVNNNFYKEKGLNVFSIMVVKDSDILKLPKGEAYIR